MAEKLNLPKDVVNLDWRKVGYATYEDEDGYIPPKKVSPEALAMIKGRNQKLGKLSLFMKQLAA